MEILDAVKNEKKSQEDIEYEVDLVNETAARMEDLAMALCHYDPNLAKTALAVALGIIIGEYPEGLCVHSLTELVASHSVKVRKMIEAEELKEKVRS